MIINILLNIILSILVLYLLYYLNKIKKINKNLFTRSWNFELFILTIYDEVSVEHKNKIKILFDTIDPL